MDHENGKYSASPPVLKKMIPQLLLSVSIFSFVFSYSSLYSSSSSSLVYSPSYKFHHNFSANYSFPFLSHIALNKNCLFLICNGLLVFLAKTSGLVRPPPEDSTATAAATADLINDILQKRIGDGQQMPMDQELPPEEINQPEEEKKLEDRESNFSTETSSEEVSITIVESEEEGSGEKDEISDEGRTSWLFDDDVDDEGEQLYRQQFEEEEEEEEEGDEEEKEELSTEELNQKFEDFIRKMKEEIMISDARQKVVALK